MAAPRGFRDLSSPTRDGTWALVVKAQSPKHWATREFPYGLELIININTVISYNKCTTLMQDDNNGDTEGGLGGREGV